ncbi:hypothetical protein HEK616_37940 [Streptomyces nigrescens]|uniref:Integral membrane protein n=1 Tax=Streptomyces nigrescens TaxID=1920 RepID=A0ABN6QVT3_STRNI|nr:hypothetical protein [Streptomyces nigrescens]BDM70307.1 hypothetical protein HEK616_37940 [Streptomyces nigrescens]
MTHPDTTPKPDDAPSPSDPRRPDATRGLNLFLGFAPWIIFAVVASPSSWGFAALAALITAIGASIPDIRRRSLKILDIAGMLFFAVICTLSLVLDRHALIWLETYAQTLSAGVLAVVALTSLAFMPFTEQYARESVPRAYWGSPLFRHVNRVLTAVWGAVFLVTALLGVLALHTTSGADWLNWIIPIALLVGAVRFTRWYPDQARARAQRSAASAAT